MSKPDGSCFGRQQAARFVAAGFLDGASEIRQPLSRQMLTMCHDPVWPPLGTRNRSVLSLLKFETAPGLKDAWRFVPVRASDRWALGRIAWRREPCCPSRLFTTKPVGGGKGQIRGVFGRRVADSVAQTNGKL
eukprot:TRINITY_DN17638_c0_g1_i1.p2 TRINITY_DN17638_c0_g1~~TRINITY_DN17638_c0_g1_i1.p2  ORF type:complete len:133 (-),score=17.81 TRINITY_DN17638_c0_g1_i1:162-560(-)